MPLEHVNLNNEHLCVWLTDTQGMVFHQGHKSLYKLEPLSLALLFALDEGIAEQQVMEELQQHSNLEPAQIKPSLLQVKKLFINDQVERSYADGLYPELKDHQRQQVKADFFKIKVANSTFAITCQDKQLLNHIKQLLAPIALEQNTSTEEVDFLFEIENCDENYTLYSNDQAVEEDLSVNQVMPLLIDRLQILSYQQSGYTFGFHGAALEKVSQTQEHTHRILLPGVSGAGKSTLTAELSKQDYQVYSDEIIAINDDLSLTPLQLPMAIKSGSWQHIGELYVDVDSLVQWHRKDGRILKYIWPDKIASCQKGSTLNQIKELLEPKQTIESKMFLVSPKFNKEATPAATKLEILDIIELVTHGGYQLGVELTTERVEQLIEFCQSIEAYQITYATSEQAHSLIDKIVSR